MSGRKLIALSFGVTVVGLLLPTWAAAAAAAADDAVETGELNKNEKVYFGTIEENAQEGDEVYLNVPLVVDEGTKFAGDVCGYTMYKWHSEQPFKIVLLDRKTGQAKIVLDAGFELNYEKKHRFSFEIAPYDCVTGSHGERAKVHVKVEDVNEFAPVWKENVYSTMVEEGSINDQIIKIHAVDSDGSQVYSKICQYHILTPDVPFEIDENGYLRNTDILQYSKMSRYELEVKAEDCGGKISDKVTIGIDVKPICKPMWTGVDERLEVTGSTRQMLMPGATLDLCDIECDTNLVMVTVDLETSKIGKGCDRDIYSLQAHRKICGASLDNLDLLPSPARPGSWTHDLQTDGGQESNPVFVFDGVSTAVDIPTLEMRPIFDSRFTVSTWMKHEQSSTDLFPHGKKEYILCSSDGEVMSRNHFGLFIHNCRLILLLRQEPSADLDSLKPAEWRWSLIETCDGKWHHFAISVDLPNVSLYVDGKLFVETKNNPEILDDWPLHDVKDVQTLRMVVGASWQGAKHRMGHFFHGMLSGLSILHNHTDSDDVILCLNNCQEKLELTGLDEMATGMSVSMNSEMTRISVNGLSVDSVEKLVRNVGYVNSRVSPTPGDRSLVARTTVKCSDNRELSVEDLNMTIAVREANPIVITVNGTDLLIREEHTLLDGELLFQDLVITGQRFYDGSLQDFNFPVKTEEFLLDSCVVRLEPRMNLDVERFLISENMTEQLGMEVELNEDGLIIVGADSLASYQQFLNQVQYVNSKPQDSNSRSFVVSCTELSEHFLSNQLTVTLEITHVIPQQTAAPHALQLDEASHPVAKPSHSRLVPKSFQNGMKYDAQETGVGVAVVMIVCIGFVVMLIVLGVMRVRSAQRCKGNNNRDDRHDANWDSSSLTITINPMDPDSIYEDDAEEIENADYDDEDSDSRDEDAIYEDRRVAMDTAKDFSNHKKSTLVL